MKERPILMNGAMVRATMNGNKTQTRRIVKPEGAHHLFQFRGKDWLKGADEPTGEWAWCSSSHLVSKHIHCPFGKPGDRLWVRESFTATRDRQTVLYRADPFYADMPKGDLGRDWSWTPSIHMPRSASRITLQITDVRVEKLQDISEKDARAEGVTIQEHHMRGYCAGECYPPFIRAFRDLWESINGAGSWEANPWLWIVEFRKLEQAGSDAEANARNIGNVPEVVGIDA